MIKERLILTFLLLWQSIEAKNLLDEIKANPNFSKAHAIIESSALLPILLKTRGFTAFMPTNEAMDEYKGVKDEKLIAYHLANIPYKIQEMPDEITTELTGNPRVYVTRIPSGQPSITGWEDYEYFINNAKVTSANHRAQSESGEVAYLHTVDRVIAPTVAQTPAGSTDYTYRYPDARKVLEKSNVYGFGDHIGLRELFNRVDELGMLDIFEMEGKNTFFMPVNHALKALIDKQVIHGHIVPDEVLFTRTVRETRKQYKTLAFTDNVKAFISLENITNLESKDVTYYVTSNVVNGKTESAFARIVKGNIPVKNGVIHLIDRPLMVIASSIISYLQEKEGQLNQFHKLMVENYSDMANLLVTQQDITLFAPSNKAFEMVNQNRLDKVIANREKLVKILQLHIVKRRLTTNEIVEQTTNEIFQEETMSTGRKLYFAVNDPNAVVPVVSLEGGGVNATITTPNIATKNGVIHIIDRILGIPSQTVYEKLASDPMLSSTFALSEQKNWNKPLKDRNKKFTLFVPSNTAWQYIGREMPSAHKKIFMGEFATHVHHILQRHMIVNEDLTMEELDFLTSNSTPTRDNIRQTQLQMTRGKIYFQAKVKTTFGEMPMGNNMDDFSSGTLVGQRPQIGHQKEKEYFLEWNGKLARVIRPDVECVNGVVHVIDKVLMTKSDVTVSGSNSYTSGGVATLVSAIMSVTLAWSLI